MRIGVIFPQTEIGPDRAAIREYATTVDDLGYDHLLAYDHVLGADPEVHQGWQGPYDVRSTFHEPFALFGYLAAITSLELITGIIILPQRQTALVAKQAAEVDLLTGGRFRLGVGLGWNPVEYQALGRDFATRGRRVSEQVELLRLLWCNGSVSFRGRYETVTGAGIAPLPIQRPIPVWFGAASESAYRRAGRLGDGWLPLVPPGPHLDAACALVEEAALTAGRDPAVIGMEGRVNYGNGGVDQVLDHVERWRAANATHLCVNTMNAGLGGVDRHLDVLRAVAGALGLSPAAPQ